MTVTLEQILDSDEFAALLHEWEQDIIDDFFRSDPVNVEALRVAQIQGVAVKNILPELRRRLAKKRREVKNHDRS